MDAATTVLIGAGIGAGGGALTTIIGSVSTILWDRTRHRRDLEDGRSARLLDRRITAHQALYTELMNAEEWVERMVVDPPQNYEPTADDVFASNDYLLLLRTVQMLSSKKTGAAALTAVKAAREYRAAGLVGTAEQEDVRLADLMRAREKYHEAIQQEIGAT